MKTFSMMTRAQKSKLTIYQKEEIMKNIILVAIEEQFRRTKGAKYYWLQFIANSRPVQQAIRDILQLNINSRQDHTHLFHFVSYAISNHSLYSTVRAYDITNINYYQFIQRASKYAHVTDYRSFMQQICNHPEGILVNEQLLIYTYENIQVDIKQAIKKMDVVKILHSDPETTTYFIFPNLVAKNYNVLISKNQANIRKSMIKQICRQINSNQMQKIQQSNRNYETISEQDWRQEKWDLNYKLQYFSQNKKRWIQFQKQKNNGQKLSFKFINDSKNPQYQIRQSWQTMMMNEDMRMFGPYSFDIDSSFSLLKDQNLIESKSDPHQSIDLTEVQDTEIKIQAQDQIQKDAVPVKHTNSKKKSVNRQVVNIQD